MTFSQILVKWKYDHFHLSNFKTVFPNVVKGMAGKGLIFFKEHPWLKNTQTVVRNCAQFNCAMSVICSGGVQMY